MSQLFTNNASGTLSVQLEPGHSTLVLQAGEAALFPSPTGADFALATIEDAGGNIEIVKITANDSPSTDVLTISRAQESTAAQQFVTGSRVELRVTAGTFDEFVQRSGDTMTGELNMADQVLRDPLITGGEARGLTLRGTDGGTANQLVVPTAGAAPTIGGQTIYTASSLPANNRIDHTTITITAGSGLSYSVGGADISADSTIDIDTSGLTTMASNVLAATDTVLVRSGGTNKTIQVQALGMRVQTGLSGTLELVASNMNSIMNFTGTATLTLPLNVGVPLPIGVPIVLNMRHATQKLTVTAAASVILMSIFHPEGDTAVSDAVLPGGTALLYKVATNTWALTGDIANS